MFGAPSVGKGTYTRRLRQKYPWPHISTGDLFRENIKNGTELGKEAKGYMDKGELVPDEITINMLKERLAKEDAQDGFFLDGFPRTTAQAEALESITDIDLVMNFTADNSVLTFRVSGRRICRECGEIYNLNTKLLPQKEGVCDKCGGELYQRPDEKEEIFKERLRVYHEQTAPVLDFYKEKGILESIDGTIDISDPRCNIIEQATEIIERRKQELGK